MKLNELDTYRMYLAIKQHFTNDKYDFFEYKGNVKNCTPKSLISKNYYQVICKLSRTYDAKALRDYFVSNMLVFDGKYIFDVDSEGNRVYNDYLRRRDSRTYMFKQDIDRVCHELEKRHLSDFWESIKVESDTTHPLLFRMFVGSYICPETMALLQKINPYIGYWDSNISDELLYPQVSKQLRKYEPFVMVKDVSPFAKIICDTNNSFFNNM